MPKNGLNVSLNSYDDIFSTEEARQEEQREQVQQISIEELHPFKDQMRIYMWFSSITGFTSFIYFVSFRSTS